MTSYAGCRTTPLMSPPKAKDEETLSERAEVRCTPSEREMYEKAVKRSDDRTLSQWARRTLNAAARKLLGL